MKTNEEEHQVKTMDINNLTSYINPIYYVIIGIIITATAQILLKLGSSHEILKLKWLVFLFFSLFCYSLSFVTYYLALRYYDISKISPIMMSSIICIITVYGFVSGEHINLSRIFGIGLAIISIIFINRS
jgi:drug/metabolite transporter (DMT)-like permease